MSKAKSDAIERKKEEKETDNRCKHCGSKKHESKECKKEKEEEGEE